MRKKYLTYRQHGRVKKAVMDESLYRQLAKDPTVEELTEYETEMLMEKRFAEKIGVSNNRQSLMD